MILRVRLGICLGHTIAGVSDFVKPQHVVLAVEMDRMPVWEGKNECARTENPSFREAGGDKAVQR